MVTGDPSQQDLPGAEASGLSHALRILRGIPGVAQCRFTGTDVMRHPLVQEIVRAYDDDSRGRARGRDRREANREGSGPSRAAEPEAPTADPATAAEAAESAASDLQAE